MEIKLHNITRVVKRFKDGNWLYYPQYKETDEFLIGTNNPLNRSYVDPSKWRQWNVGDNYLCFKTETEANEFLLKQDIREYE